MVLLSGKARLAGVVGWPVGHSLSPRLHGHWFERHGVDGAYVPLAVRPEDLEAAFRLLPRLGFLGWNVTLPHKEAACRLVDALDPAAEAVGAVNTVLVGEDGRTRGLSTDGEGFLAGLRAAVPGWSPRGESRGGADAVVVLGAGGAARAVAAALLGAGAGDLRLANRSEARAERLAGELARWGGGGGRVAAVPWEERGRALAGAGLLVNATSLGMDGQPSLEIDLAGLPAGAVVADLVYVPLETPLLAAARARGHAAVDGLGMLLHQAAPGFAHWGGAVPAVDAALRARVLEGFAGR